MITLALTGDVMLGRGVDEALGGMRPDEPWGDTLSLLGSADLRIINLECAITTHENPWSRTHKIFHFRADPSRALRVLRAARIDERAVLFDAASTATAVYARDRLPAGAVLDGPALIEEAGTTTLVPPGFRASVDLHANLLLVRGAP